MTYSDTQNTTGTDISIEVAFATETRQKIIQLKLPINSTARQAVQISNLALEFPQFDFDSAPLGVFGRKVPDDYLLTDQDRVEIYRPLQQSPQDARRQRVKSASGR